MAQSIKAKLAERDEDDDLYDDHLDDIGTVDTLGKDLSLRDVAQAMQYIRSHMFDDIPDHRSGMNSARITEVLNFRKALPTIITNAHVHALINSPTAVEKEIAQLVSAELLRRVTIPGRGIGAGSVSDCIVLVKDWVTIVQASSSLSSELKGYGLHFNGLSGVNTPFRQIYIIPWI